MQSVINNAYQQSIGNTPFFLNYGYHPKTPTDLSVVRGTGDPVKERLSALKLAKQCLEQAQQRMRLTSNKHRRHVEFQVGDFVLLSAKNLELKFEGTKKLMHKYFGPFEILKRVGPVAYELKIPLSMGIHDVFHVSLLKLYEKAGAGVVVPPQLYYHVVALSLK